MAAFALLYKYTQQSCNSNQKVNFVNIITHTHCHTHTLLQLKIKI